MEERPPQAPAAPSPQEPPASSGQPLAGQEPPGGWQQPVAQTAYPADAYAVKRSLGRVWGFTLISFGLYMYFWFYTYRKKLDAELGHGRDDAALHTAGLLVPVLNFFIVHWLWRDLNHLRTRVGLGEFPEVPYLIGSIFLAPVFYSLVNQELNEYWDVRTQGRATDAPVTTGEKVVVGIGAAFFLLWLLIMVLVVILAVVAGSSS